ncbi:solute carrier family 13 member 2 isoform X2 [Python bivittatus]|uniref:Solute carrier family 13 member 2 isoform X2 n=1 Tax=Python bivittatus TaxID=176946 RepID=A0A9F5N125_PYTBI|nr:solute carrier family 13 member 2 isoform X2 [Python bivittatus]
MWREIVAYRNYLITVLTPLVFLPLPLVLPHKEAQCGYTIILMAIFWCTEALPLAVTALIPVLFFPLMGIMDSTTVCMEYLKDANMLFIGGLLVAIAVEHWNLHRRIALQVLLIIGVRPALLLMGFMGITAFLSMWISNTATTAMMVPIAHAVLQQLHKSELEQSAAEQEGVPNGTINRAFELQEAPHPQVQVVAKGKVPEEQQQLGQKLQEDQIQLQQKHETFCKGMSLAVCYSASIGGIATLTGTTPNLVMKGQMDELFCRNNNVVNFASWFTFAFPAMVLLLSVSWLWLLLLFLGLDYVTDATVVIFISLLMFLIPSKMPGCSSRGQLEGSPGQVCAPPALLDWATVNRQMPWNIVILLGGGFALAKGSEVSGLSKWLGSKLAPLQTIPHPAIAFLLSLLVAVFTECTSNVATTTLFLPILASMAQAIELNPLYVMLPCTLAASLAFMLPVATPPNAIVFSYGHLRVIDMVKAGCMLNVLGVLTIMLAINTWGIPLFDLHQFPSWASSNATRC